MTPRTRPLPLLAGSLLLAAGAFTPVTAAAQQPEDIAEMGAFVYEGTCDALSPDAIVESIGDLELENDQDDIDEAWAVLGSSDTAPERLFVEDEDIDGSVDVLVDEPHAVAVHEHEDRDSKVIACGDITAMPDEESFLITLSEVDGSGVEGRAGIQPDDQDDDDDEDEIKMVVGVWERGAIEPLASPSPAF